jgi:predicted DNA-binding antitoxin AbrB/MazE fold protein
MSIASRNNRRRHASMVKEFRARFLHGVLEPLETVDLKEGEEVKVIIAERPTEGKGMIEALRASAGGWKGLIDAEELKRNIYADRLISTRHEPKL